MSKSTYLANKLLEEVLKATGYSAPANVYMALYSEDPQPDDSGDEATGGSYARQLITFDAAAAGAIASNVDVVFASMPAGTWTHFAIHDHVSAGNMLHFDELTTPITTLAGSDITFPTGEVVVNEA